VPKRIKSTNHQTGNTETGYSTIPHNAPGNRIHDGTSASRTSDDSTSPLFCFRSEQKLASTESVTTFAIRTGGPRLDFLRHPLDRVTLLEARSETLFFLNVALTSLDFLSIAI
jgi:hypothetical protein